MKKHSISSFLLTIFSALLALVFMLPLIWALSVSLQVEGKQITSISAWFTPPYTLLNYVDIIFNSAVSVWMLNSLFIAVITTAAALLLSSMVAFALAKLTFKGKNSLYFYFLLGILVPAEATIVPLFITANGLNLIDTYAGLIFPMIAGSMNVIIMTSFFKGLPNELIEAVRIDGGNELTIFINVILPLSKAVLSTVCIFTFVGSWNNYLWPLLCAMSSSKFTLPIGIPTFSGTYAIDYVRPLTASMTASIPVIIMYIIFEKQIVQGISLSGIKG